MTEIGRFQDGLDVTSPDVTTQEEIEAYRAEYLGSNKGLLDSFEFWLEFRPDVLKRHKARTRHFRTAKEPDRPLVQILAAIHAYTISAFPEGVAYEIRLAQTLGCHAGRTSSTRCPSPGSTPGIAACTPPRPTRATCATYEDPPPSSPWPEGWTFDPQAFDSGMDYTGRDATAEDMERLEEWYRTTLGEIPPYVRFLAAHRPGLLKAYRDRYEHAIRDSLPKQMLPYLMLSHNVGRGFRDGIRENVLLGRALGMTREQLLDAICFAVLDARRQRPRPRGRRRRGRARDDGLTARQRGRGPACHASPGFFGCRYWWPCCGSGGSTSPTAARASRHRSTSSSSSS